MAKKAEPIEIDLSVEISPEARQGLGKEQGKAGMATVGQMERHLLSVLHEELNRLAGETPDEGEDERD